MRVTCRQRPLFSTFFAAGSPGDRGAPGNFNTPPLSLDSASPTLVLQAQLAQQAQTASLERMAPRAKASPVLQGTKQWHVIFWSVCLTPVLLLSPPGPPGPPGGPAPNALPPPPPSPTSVAELTPDTSRASEAFTNPLNSRPTFVVAPRPAASFNRASNEFINYGPLDFSLGSTGVSFVTAFSFTGSVGTWERIFDFGNGPDSGNYILAREGTSNTLILLTNFGRGSSQAVLRLPNYIQQNQIIVSVVTCVMKSPQFQPKHACITLHQVHSVGHQRHSQVVGQR
jgi:hypothetical protein